MCLLCKDLFVLHKYIDETLDEDDKISMLLIKNNTYAIEIKFKKRKYKEWKNSLEVISPRINNIKKRGVKGKGDFREHSWKIDRKQTLSIYACTRFFKKLWI